MLLNWTDILDGEIVNAGWVVASMATKRRASRRESADLDAVGWADTASFIEDALPALASDPELLILTEDEASALAQALGRHEVQGAFQSLLAVRLTDAPETDASMAREAVKAALSGALTSSELWRARPDFKEAAAAYAAKLSEYADDRICAVVTRLEGRLGREKLSQIRSEAYSARIVALLGAIERQMTALTSPEIDSQSESNFLEQYRRQVCERHGKIEPPDFQRRRRMPIEKIYVPVSIYKHDDRRVDFGWHEAGRSGLDIEGLAGLISRTVLLGDPGGGKTTTANVLAYRFARDGSARVPFLVTLRDYAAVDPPAHSIVNHIARTLETLYQCTAKPNAIERLLLTGRALVIFDGLDELVDTSRRRDVSDRVEQFCSAYPLTPVVVTSRVVGYEEARLDDRQFTCYRLGGLDKKRISEYVSKWFSAQENFTPAEARKEALAFLAESESVPDLRFNPLMLSLMCILYRGARSLPKNRAGIYGRCAELLLGKWDESRKIHHELQAGHLVEPAIRHLAWWLLTDDDSRAAVTERELVNETAAFLCGPGFESMPEARAAAVEFVEFCRGRMWVFSDTGTTADGEKLYSFTHRTFLEYFAAAHLATVSDTPEDLARTLAPVLDSAGPWNLVGQLAIQIKDRNSSSGADRIYASLLDVTFEREEAGPLLNFLIEGLEVINLSPGTLRMLVRAALEYRIPRASRTVPAISMHPLLQLTKQEAQHQQLLSDEISTRIEEVLQSGNATAVREALLIILEIGYDERWSVWRPAEYWIRWSDDLASRYSAKIIAESARSSILRDLAIKRQVLSLEQALEMPGGLGALMQFSPGLLSVANRTPYPQTLVENLDTTSRYSDCINNLAIAGSYLVDHRDMPWARLASKWTETVVGQPPVPSLSHPLTSLGYAAIVAMWNEISHQGFRNRPEITLPMPEGFHEIFQDWSEGRINFVEFGDE
jgi:hypothetical protein